ncbi:hypothetical protein IC221_05360 [Flammeovirga sp. EKP202]|nr:hypothetical protein [Flammeovirga sp. EKP202]
MGIVSMEDIPGTRVKILTVVESIVPSGIGRSRIIESTTLIDAEQLTTSRTDGTDTKQGSVSRRQNKAPSQKETKLLNLFNVGGINFQNIATNDAILTSKITGLLIEGWDLKFVNSAVESNAGEDDATGIFLTRYIFIK